MLAAVVVSLAQIAHPVARAGDAAIVLEIGGTAGLGFEGRCVIRHAGDTRPVAIHGRVPERHTFVADGVDCRISPTRRGRLEVALRLRGGGSTTRSSITGGPGNVVHLSMSR